jgi:hypothetical protein
MGWSNVGKDAVKGSDLPILKFEAGKPVRIRLIAVEGTKYAEPAKRFQHWSNDTNISGPIACIGPRAGCLFHTPPLDWRVSASFVMNAVYYILENGAVKERKIVAMPAGASVYGHIKDHADIIGVNPTEVDWIINRTGTGKNDTKYTVVMAPGGPLDKEINLAEYPDQAAYADKNYPQLVDYDGFDGYRMRSLAEQEAWLEEKLGTGDGTVKLGSGPVQAALSGSTQEALPAPSPVVDAEYKEQTPVAKIGGTPPPPPDFTKPQVVNYMTMPDPWGKKNMGELDAKTLEYILETDGFTVEYKNAAAQLLHKQTQAPSPSPLQTDDESFRAMLAEKLKSLKCLKSFTEARKFLSIGGASSVKNMPLEGVQKLLGLANQGEEAVVAAINAL